MDQTPFATPDPYADRWVNAYAQPQPQPTAVAPAAPTRRTGGLRLTALALVAALAGGAVSAVAVTSLQPATATPTASVTRVVQGQTSAPDWTATAEAAAGSVVSIQVSGRAGSAEGSGVILDASGNIATNHHVVNGVGTGADLQVTLADRRVYAATVVGSDAATDLAVIRLSDPPKDLRPISVSTDPVKVGQPVMAVGNPLGLSQTVTTGIVSAVDRPVVTQQQSAGSRGAAYQSQQSVTSAIQTSAAINPGNSGGALVAADGRLIGITSSIATVGQSTGEAGNIGIGFAIPAQEVTRVTQDLIKSGHASHAYLGVATADGTGRDGDADVLGAVVKTVAEGTPAQRAGIAAGDVVIAVAGEPVGSSEALMAQVRDHAVGEQVAVTVLRQGRRTDIPVTLADQPA